MGFPCGSGMSRATSCLRSRSRSRRDWEQLDELRTVLVLVLVLVHTVEDEKHKGIIFIDWRRRCRCWSCASARSTPSWKRRRRKRRKWQT